MKPTRTTMGRSYPIWRGKRIWSACLRDGNHLYYVDEEGGIAPQRVVYEFSLELFQLLKSGEKHLKKFTSS